MKKITLLILASVIGALCMTQPAYALGLSVDVGATSTTGNSTIEADITVTGDSSASSDISVTSIATEADLTAYAEAVQAEDENVGSVQTTEDEVAVEYTQRLYLFGFIPVKSTVQAVATADGSVEVRYPWYAFLSSSSRAEVEARVQNSVDAALKDGVGAEGQFSARVRAGLVSAMRAALKTSLEADLAVEAGQ